MKKSILKSAVVMVALSGMSFAGVVFDLQQQHFFNSLKTEVIASKYELPNVYVTTNLNLKSDTYNYQNRTGGHFHIELKEALSIWNMTFDLDIWFTNNDSITLYDVSGKSFVIAFKDERGGKLYFDNKEVYTANYNIKGSIQLVRNGTEIVLKINGSDIATTEGLSFGQLKTVQTKFNSGNDYLHSLIIASN